MVQVKFTKIALSLCFLLCGLTCRAGIAFQFAANTISNGPLKTRMESNISALLTEIDRAGRNGSPLNLTGIDMEPEAKKRLIALWGDAHFICDKQTNVYKCLNDSQGYQVRDIPVTIRPLDASYEQSLNRELTISLSKTGVITGVRPALENHDIKSMLSAGGVEDVRQRREILKWVEDFRCYYNEKNLRSLTQIYSDDALIITGSVVQQRKTIGDVGVKYDSKINYKHQSKEEYIKNLSRVFGSNSRINVEFDNIAVVRHPAKTNIYGVTLRQKWQSGSYRDEGWLFLLWDFSDPERPQIHVRTWQPESYVTKDDVFTLDDFFLP